jgi:hypothetical protein
MTDTYFESVLLLQLFQSLDLHLWIENKYLDSNYASWE